MRAVVFVDTVGSTRIATTLGDKRWQELLRRELLILRRVLKERGGQEVDTAGDGLFALFREPAPAVRFAASACEAVRELGLEIRAGVHFGEVEFSDGRPGGIVVHTGARAMGVGGGGEVLVTQTVRELVSGGDLSFADHGTHTLKGIPGTSALYRLKEIDDRPVAPPLPEDEAAERMRESSQRPPLVRRRAFLAGVTAAVAGSLGTYLLTRAGEPIIAPQRNNRVFRFDPATKRLTMLPSSLSDPNQNSLSCIAVGEGGVWVGGIVLHHVDPTNGTVEDVSVATAGGIPPVNDVAIGDDDVWFVDFRAVYRVDPADNELLDSFGFDTRAGGPNLSPPTSVVVGLGAVWVSLQDGSLYRFKGGGPLKRPDRITLDGAPADLLIAANNLWVADEFGRILRLDRGGSLVDAIDVGGQPKALTATEDRIWAVDPEGLVVVVDPLGRREPQRKSVEGDLVDVAAGPDAVWVADNGGDLIELDPVLREVVSRTPVGGPIAALAVDEERGVVWIRTSPVDL